MIDRDGTVRKSIPEDQVANHVFTYSGRSIGIELVKEGDGIDPFPEPQLAALVSLLRDIRQRHRVPRDGIKRHSDPDRGRLACDPSQRRKVDPGAAFPLESVIGRVMDAGSRRHRD
jgi:N-acetyl-anhydromuramyl-L-alanine amidase AmpD